MTTPFGIVVTVITLLLTPRPSAATPTPATNPPLDLAAMMLLLEDLEAVGLPNYGTEMFQEGAPRIEALARGLATFDEARAKSIEAALEAAGWHHGYVSTLTTPARPGDPNSPDAGFVACFAYEHTTDEGAAETLTLLSREPQIRATIELPTTPRIGDASVLASIGDPDSGFPPPGIALRFRRGTVVAGVAVLDTEEASAEASIVKALGQRLLARVDRVRAGEAPNLSIRALRFAGDTVVSTGPDGYAKLDGVVIPRPDEPDEEFAERTAEYAGARDVYRFAHIVRVVENSSDGIDRVIYYSTLYRFESEEAASDWLHAVPRSLRGQSGVRLGPDADIGDESLVVTYGSGSPMVMQAFVRVADAVAIVRLDGSYFGEVGIPVTESAITAVSDAQATCLQIALGCLDPVAVPPEVIALERKA